MCNWNSMKFVCVCDKMILLIKCSVTLLRVLKCLRTPIISHYLEVHGMAVEFISWQIFCFTIFVLLIFIVSYSWNANLVIKMCIVLVYLPSEEIDIVLWRYPRILSMAPAVLCSSSKCPKMPLKRPSYVIISLFHELICHLFITEAVCWHEILPILWRRSISYWTPNISPLCWSL
jgi:hypothetical protein